MPLKIKTVEKSKGFFTLFLTGSLDTSTHQVLDNKLQPVLSALPKAVILDMKGVEYLSSMGVGVIFKTRKALEANSAELLMVNLKPQVQNVLDIVKALPSMEVFSDVDELDRYLYVMQRRMMQKKSGQE